jgi:hypothetical protein
MGMWKEAVSRAQRARKKMYWKRTGCAARKGEGTASLGSVVVLFVRRALLLVIPPVMDENESREDGFEGVAFSIRAHVR